ncbi:MauE/DoxX family redox-associated membrane protein [Melghirimyces algeriensis]|uniref:Methylamine utilisation protein MauE n=1 Tax=Melghirimyces algeriensis TaxID=910412 RepID=A0A521D3Z9_9BACL|nr:MauE/DoxX family redox-associated membrane protein [Melghirimyces algeriensis]SMO65640.1 Methylamine utilisation protein MauE [Melghirimyces algeriensis]
MIVSFFLRMTLAILFLTTAWSKWRGWDRHTQLMTAYRIIPSGWVPWFLGGFLISECYIALTLLLFGFQPITIGLGLGLLFLYTGAVVINLVRGNQDISCGCGSVLESDRLSWGLVVRNLFLMAMVVLGWMSSLASSPEMGWIHQTLLTLVAVGVILIAGNLKGFWEIKRKIEKLATD